MATYLMLLVVGLLCKLAVSEEVVSRINYGATFTKMKMVLHQS